MIMDSMTLKESDFVDLYVGNDYAEIKGLLGDAVFLKPVPDLLLPDVRLLRDKCLAFHRDTQRTEYSLHYDSRLYRVTVARDCPGEIELVIRQTPKDIKPFESIPFSSDIRTSIEHRHATGLILISGEMASGKTTTAASILSHRISINGNLGVSIEDPAEAALHGRHGKGRCIQLEVKENEGYSHALKKAYRTGATSFLLGEIRDGATAHEVLKASLSMFVVSTIHAPNVYDALDRYVMFCEEHSPNAKTIIANTLYVIAHQKMTFNNGNRRMIDIAGYNLRHAKTATAIKVKISGGHFKSLKDHFDYMEYNFEDN